MGTGDGPVSNNSGRIGEIAPSRSRGAFQQDDMSAVGEIEAKTGVLGEETSQHDRIHTLPNGAQLHNAKIYEQEDSDNRGNPIDPLPVNNTDDLVQEFLKGKLLVHARAKDGQDFKHGINPSAGEFLRSTDAWQTAKEMHDRETKLTFFADKDTDLDAWAKHFAARGKPVELVFVRKDPSIVKYLGENKVETSDGQKQRYELSEVADFEDPAYRDVPAGVEHNDWFTRETQPVVGVVDYQPPTKNTQTTKDIEAKNFDNININVPSVNLPTDMTLKEARKAIGKAMSLNRGNVQLYRQLSNIASRLGSKGMFKEVYGKDIDIWTGGDKQKARKLKTELYPIIKSGQENQSLLKDIQEYGATPVFEKTHSVAAEGAGRHIIGKPVRDAQDVAALASLFRSPKKEISRAIYVKDGKVVAVDSWTSDLVTSVSNNPPEVAQMMQKAVQEMDRQYSRFLRKDVKADPTKKAQVSKDFAGAIGNLQKATEAADLLIHDHVQKHDDQIIAKYNKTGADKIYFLHNHPRVYGASPSDPDIELALDRQAFLADEHGLNVESLIIDEAGEYARSFRPPEEPEAMQTDEYLSVDPKSYEYVGLKPPTLPYRQYAKTDNETDRVIAGIINDHNEWLEDSEKEIHDKNIAAKNNPQQHTTSTEPEIQDPADEKPQGIIHYLVDDLLKHALPSVKHNEFIILAPGDGGALGAYRVPVTLFDRKNRDKGISLIKKIQQLHRSQRPIVLGWEQQPGKDGVSGEIFEVLSDAFAKGILNGVIKSTDPTDDRPLLLGRNKNDRSLSSAATIRQARERAQKTRWLS